MKGYITAAFLMAVMVFGTTFAHAGIIVAGRDGHDDPCKEQTEDEFKLDGIIVAGVKAIETYLRTGIIVAGKTGIIVAGKSSQETCGIIVAG